MPVLRQPHQRLIRAFMWSQPPAAAERNASNGGSFSDPEFYGDSWADIYDTTTTHLDTAAAVGFLGGLAGDGRVLELGIGTGRMALPLAARGIRVDGIDASAAMVEKLRAKPGGTDIRVVIGDMADVTVMHGPYRVAFLIYNSLFLLTSQSRQAECFRNVSAVLEPGGVFVIECFVPDLTRLKSAQLVRVDQLTEDSATLEVSMYDINAQLITAQMINFSTKGIHLGPVALRYAWPAELDLMAAQAGLTLRGRSSDWTGSPFRPGSERHISVYEKTADDHSGG